MAVAEAAPPVRLYERGSVLRRAARELRALLQYRELVQYLVRSELRVSTTGRVFGFVWWLLDPLLLMATYVILVKVIFHRGGADYPVFVFTSILAFRFFTSAVLGAMGRTIAAQGLMKQVLFPRSVLPLSAVVTQAFHYAFGLVILMLFALPFGILPAPVDLLVIPIVALQFVFTLALALGLSALNVFVRDIQNVMAFVFRLMFYLSPGLYSLDRVPEQYRKFVMLNPLSPLFESYHDVVLSHRLPHFAALGWLLLVSTVLLSLGYLVFVRLERSFNKVL